MMKTFQDWMDEGLDLRAKSFKRTRGLEMNDGTKMSIQASECHYCSPQENLGTYSDYYSFEIGFPSKEFSILRPYAENENELTNTVYPQVPVCIINEIISQCGGVKGHQQKQERI